MWPNLQETADLVTFNEEFLNGKLNFLYSVTYLIWDVWVYTLSKFEPMPMTFEKFDEVYDIWSLGKCLLYF